MADIDLVIDVQNQRANAQLAQTAAMTKTLNTTAGQTAGGMVKLNQVFNQGALAAGLAATNMGQMNGLLALVPAVANPASLAVTGIATGIALLVKEAQKYKGIKFDRELAATEAAARGAARGFDAWRKVMAGGGTESEASFAQILAKTRAEFDETEKRLNDDTAKREERVKFLQSEVEKFERLAGSYEKGHEAIQRYTIAGEKARKEIAAEEAAIRANNQQLEDEARKVNETVRLQKERQEAIEGATKATRDQGSAGITLIEITKEVEEAKRRENAEWDAYLAKLREAMAMEAARKKHGTPGMFGPGLSVAIPALSKNTEKTFGERMEDSGEMALIDAMAGSYNAYADALDRTISLQTLFSESTGRAMRNAVAQSVRAIGMRAQIEGAMEAAKAIRDYADGNIPGAIGHTKSAGMFFAVAAAAGAASGALSVNAGSTGGNGGGGFVAGSNPDSRERSGPTINVTVIGTLDTAQREELWEQLYGEAERRNLSGT